MLFPNPFEIYMPYCLEKIAEGQYVLLNWHHHPIGWPLEHGLPHDEYPITYEFDELTPAVAASISVNGATNRDRIYLYNSSCLPWSEDKHMVRYRKRLARLHLVARYRWLEFDGVVSELHVGDGVRHYRLASVRH